MVMFLLIRSLLFFFSSSTTGTVKMPSGFKRTKFDTDKAVIYEGTFFALPGNKAYLAEPPCVMDTFLPAQVKRRHTHTHTSCYFRRSVSPCSLFSFPFSLFTALYNTLRYHMMTVAVTTYVY